LATSSRPDALPPAVSGPRQGTTGRALILIAPPLVTLGVTLLLARHYLGAGRQDLVVLALTISAAGAAAWCLGYLGLVAAGSVRWGGLWARLAMPALSGVLTALACIVITAQLMFISSHDLILLTLLLLFAVAISMPIAVIAARSLATRVARVSLAARTMADGRLDTRVAVDGTDELGALALAFNQMAERLEDANRRQAEAEASRRDVVAAISHDLRTPLSSIRAMIEAIQDGVVDEEMQAFYLSQMLQETRDLSALIDDLFALSQIDAGALQLHLERNPVTHLIDDAIDTMRPKADRRGVRLERPKCIVPSIVVADAARIHRVFYNLVDNALRHTPSSGAVILDVIDAGSEFEFAVQDTGAGIADADLPHVFDRFYRADRSRHDGGAGLGLAIARGIVQPHGGRIWADNGPDGGARFVFTLPKPAQ
jgi:signal transduction histidine kinase